LTAFRRIETKYMVGSWFFSTEMRVFADVVNSRQAERICHAAP
jgi:hypothetical protein